MNLRSNRTEIPSKENEFRQEYDNLFQNMESAAHLCTAAHWGAGAEGDEELHKDLKVLHVVLMEDPQDWVRWLATAGRTLV